MKNYAVSAFTAATVAHGNVNNVPLDPVNDILLVGAKPHPAHQDLLSNNDNQYLDRIAAMSLKLGLVFSGNVTVRGCDYPKTDFLKADLRADLVVFCKIYYDPHNSLCSQVIDRSHIRQSPLCNEEGAWHRALLRTNARYAVNVHKDEVELPTAFVSRAPFMPLVSEKHANVIYDFLVRPAVA